MYSSSDLKNEIMNVVQRAISEGRPASSAWIAMEICNRHPLPDDWRGDDYEFWMLCGTSGAQAKVRLVANELKKEQDSLQLNLPGIRKEGFRHLQKSYFVSDPSNPESLPLLVPVDQMTEEQIILKAEEYRKMAVGCNEHADELLRYLNDRKAAA